MTMTVKKERIYRNEEIEKTCYLIANTLCGKKIRSFDLSMHYCPSWFDDEEDYETVYHFSNVSFGRMFAVEVYDLDTRKTVFSCNAADICEVSFEKTGKNRYTVSVCEDDDIRIYTHMEISL